MTSIIVLLQSHELWSCDSLCCRRSLRQNVNLCGLMIKFTNSWGYVISLIHRPSLGMESGDKQTLLSSMYTASSMLYSNALDVVSASIFRTYASVNLKAFWIGNFDTPFIEHSLLLNHITPTNQLTITSRCPQLPQSPLHCSRHVHQ